MASATNTQKFQGAYNSIEAYVKSTPQYSSIRKIIPAIYELAKVNRVISEYQNDLIQMVELRNAIVHRSTEQPIAEPYDATVSLIIELRDKILRPNTAQDIATKKVISFGCNDSIKSAIDIMNNKNITNVPIVDDSKIVGILSELSVVRWIASEYDGGVASTAEKIGDIRNYLDNPNDNKDVVYRFVTKNKDIYSIGDLFDNAMKDGKRLMAVFVTNNGKSTGSIEGIITPWDLRSAS